MTTINDIAKLAGVSKASVSRVINNEPGVSEATRQIIQKIISDLDYHPNQVARSLYTKKSKLIGIIIPNIENPFYSKVISGMEKVLTEKGYQLILSVNTGQDDTKYLKALRNFQQNNVDGIISSAFNLNLEKLNFNIPLIIFDSADIKDSIIRIVSNNTKGGQLIGQKIVKLGLKKVIIQHGPLNLPTLKERFNSLVKILDANRVQYQLQEITGFFNPSQECSSLFKQGFDFEGVVAFNDIYASQILYQATHHKISVPEDLKIFGYDNIDFSEFWNITTIDQQAILIGQVAANKLLQIINTPKANQGKNEIIDVKLVERKSTQVK